MENGRWYCANGPNSAGLLQLAQPLWVGGPSQPNRAARSANGDTGGGPAGSGMPAAGAVKEGR
jgi:hypothetical protein